MDSLPRAIALLERELHVKIPPTLFAPGGHGPYELTIDPEGLLDAGSGLLRGGELLPDALPFAGDRAGGYLAIRFDAAGVAREVIAWEGAGRWHPSGLVPGLPSAAAALRDRCAAALENGLGALARDAGAAALAMNLGVMGDTFQDWLVDARLVPGQFKPPLARLTGQDDAALFDQDWEGAAAAALRAAEARPDLAWPGVVLGWFEEGRGRDAEAARAWGAALLAFTPTLDFAARWVRAGETPDRVLAAGWERCARRGDDPGPVLAAALGGAARVRRHHLAECDRLRAAGRPAEAWEAALRAGWLRHAPMDMDDVLGRLGDTAREAGSPAREALARLHLRALTARHHAPPDSR